MSIDTKIVALRLRAAEYVSYTTGNGTATYSARFDSIAPPTKKNAMINMKPMPTAKTKGTLIAAGILQRRAKFPALAKLYFRYSAMNAGKFTALLQVAHNYEENGRRVRIYTAAIDTRNGVGFVTSRLGPQRKVETFDEHTSFAEDLRAHRDVSCVLVDEAQFLQPAQVRELHRIAHVWNIPVICYGIRSDFLGEPFPGSAYLLTLADSIEEVKNICNCGKKATMNVRVDEKGRRITQGDQIAIEGPTRYVQMCGSCFYQS